MTDLAGLDDMGSRGLIAARLLIASDPDGLRVCSGPKLLARSQRREPRLW